MRYPASLCVSTLVLLSAAAAGAGTNWYVRVDGGTSSQCTGQSDAPYPGSGLQQDCAFSHPFFVLPPGGPPLMSGGDTLIIGPGSYRMGFGAPGDDACEQAYSWDCYMSAVPSGTEAQPTRILGAGWDSGCSAPPELWGAERPWFILNLSDSSHLELGCLEITDHSSCIEGHNPDDLACNGCTDRCERDTPPFGDWAPVGIYAEDSSEVHLFDLRIHGLASIGIHAGRLSNWTVERVDVIANGSAGWDFDLWDSGGDDNSGDLIFRGMEIAYNGCGEDPQPDAIITSSCWGQQSGGYGDGFAPGASGGHWVLEDLHVHHNTSDGVDMLYLRDDSSVEITRLIAEGNAGNQLKVAGSLSVNNSLLVGDCAFFSSCPLFQGVGEGDNCRAAGNSLALDLHRGSTASIINTTITGEGDCLVEVGCDDGADPDPDCDGTEAVLLRNTLFAGNTDWAQPSENTCLYWWNDSVLTSDPVAFDHSLVWNCKEDPCPSGAVVCSQDPLLEDASLQAFDAHLLGGSPAIDAGNATGAPLDDLDGFARDTAPDIGAYEWNSAIFLDGFESGDSTRWSFVSSRTPRR